MGAEISKSVKAFRPGLELQRKDVKLRTTNGFPLHVVSLSHLRVRNQSIPHNFFSVKNFNRNLILGHGWLMQNRVKLLFDFRALGIAVGYLALEEDVHISSII